MNTINVEYSNLGISRDLVSLFAKGFNEYLDLIDSLNNIDRGSESSTRYSRDQLNKITACSLVKESYLLSRRFLLLVVKDNNVLSSASVKKTTWLSKSLILLE